MANKLKFKEPEPQILTAWAERASGPGWANQLIWLIEKRPEDGKLVRRAIQPEEQTPEILQLFDVAEAAHYALMRAVIKPNRDVSDVRNAKPRSNHEFIRPVHRPAAILQKPRF